MKDTEMNIISLRYTYSIRADGIDEHEYSLVALVSLDQVWQKCSYSLNLNIIYELPMFYVTESNHNFLVRYTSSERTDCKFCSSMYLCQLIC